MEKNNLTKPPTSLDWFQCRATGRSVSTETKTAPEILGQFRNQREKEYQVRFQHATTKHNAQKQKQRRYKKTNKQTNKLTTQVGQVEKLFQHSSFPIWHQFVASPFDIITDRLLPFDPGGVWNLRI